MNRENFDEMLKNPSVIKIDTVGGGVFKDSDDIVAIQYYFIHGGDFSELPPKKRLYLSTFPLERLIPEVRAYPVENNTLTILANADSYEYALTYSLVIYPKERKIEIKLVDYPNIGSSLITQEEIDGVTLRY